MPDPAAPSPTPRPVRPAARRPRRARLATLGVALALAASAAAPAGAQEARLWTGAALGSARGAAPLRFAAEVEGPVPDGRASAAVAAGDAFAIGAGLRWSRTLGPLGNVVVDAAGALRSDGAGRAALAASGVVGPAALRLELSGRGAPASAFPGAAGARPDLDPEARVAGGAASAALAGSYRLSRGRILELRPEGLVALGGDPAGPPGGALGARLDARLRLVRFRGDDELLLLARAASTPGAGADASVGAGYRLGRRRAPSWTFVGSVGVGPGGVRPGVRIEGGERLGDGSSLALHAAWEPGRTDLAELRLGASWSRPLGPGEATVEAGATWSDGRPWRAPEEAVARAGWRVPLGR